MKTLALNILDLVQNSIRAKADNISVEINENRVSDHYVITIKDNGSGIPADILENVTDPFITTRTKRRMGLGLALIKYHAELTGGGLKVNSETGKGTEVRAYFSYSHLDRQPLGDITGVLIMLIASNPEINIVYTHITENGEYRFSSAETKEFLEADTLYDWNLLGDIGSMISENLREIGASGIEFREKVE
jgi:hypothetical protein